MTALVLSSSVAAANPGGLDGSFGADGKQTLNFGGADRATHVAITPDGRIVVVGLTDATGAGDFAVARLLADGTPDSTFDSDGLKTLGTTPGVNDIGAGVVVLPDERIVVAGQGGAAQDFVAKRLNADGSLDTSFAGAGAGTAVVDFGGNETVGSMVAQPDGKLVIVGDKRRRRQLRDRSADRGGHPGHQLLRRWQADGRLEAAPTARQRLVYRTARSSWPDRAVSVATWRSCA